MGIIWTILIGFVVGVVAKFLMPGRDPSGFFITAIIGVVGSVIATFLGRTLGLYQVGESAGFIAAVIGAIILLFLYRLVVGKKAV
ncbi:MAG: GlsB/YeaQ/YmgE family stress response membrane protein [Polaromonas sp.]